MHFASANLCAAFAAFFTHQLLQGKCWKNNCKHCKAITSPEEINLMVDIPKGAMDGERITFDGVTDEKIGHHTGNLVLVITTNPHKLFKRVGDNLNMEWTISLHDALVGFTRTFEHIDGRVVTVTRDVVTHPGEYHTVSGEGMPRKGGGKGNLIIHYTIEFPQSLTVAPRRSRRAPSALLTYFAAISKRPNPQDFGIIIPRSC